jgi:diguanylate cyclase (GGDEF)-like protein
VIARFGGEEFVAVLRTTDLHASHAVAERIRRTIAATPIRLTGTSLEVTVSLGCASLVQSQAADPVALLAAADARLYAAKAAGRNCVVSSESLEPAASRPSFTLLADRSVVH